MYKCAFLGCGPRARRHAQAYQDVKRGKIVAICDLDEERLNEFGEQFGGARYTDVHEMLEKEKPDLLHAVSIPGLRFEFMKIAADHKVPVASVEKPIALWGEDWRQIKQLGETCGTIEIRGIRVPYATMHNEPESTDPILLSDRYADALGPLYDAWRGARP